MWGDCEIMSCIRPCTENWCNFQGNVIITCDRLQDEPYFNFSE